MNRPDAVKFEIGSTVYHRADGKRGIVTGILFRPHGTLYAVAFGMNSEGWAYECELSREQEFTLTE